MQFPEIVAHRGDTEHFPENSLDAIQAAIDDGVAYVEFDVHLSRDQVPVVIHDADLRRVAGREASVFDLTAAELGQVDIGKDPRFSGLIEQCLLPTLADVVDVLRLYPHVTAFVELKRASLAHFGVDVMLQAVLDVLAPVREHCVLISFSFEAMWRARELGVPRIGWVMECYDAPSLTQASALAPDYLFIDVEQLSSVGMLECGPWQWVAYEITDATVATALFARGISHIESSLPGVLSDALGAYRQDDIE